MLRVMSDVGPLEPHRDSPEAQGRKTAGTWVSYLIFALCLLVLIALAARYAYQRQWADFAGAAVFTMLFLILPTGGWKWLRRTLRGRKSPKSPSGPVA
jgi:hypothetical protein